MPSTLTVSCCPISPPARDMRGTQITTAAFTLLRKMCFGRAPVDDLKHCAQPILDGALTA